LEQLRKEFEQEKASIAKLADFQAYNARQANLLWTRSTLFNLISNTLRLFNQDIRATFDVFMKYEASNSKVA